MAIATDIETQALATPRSTTPAIALALVAGAMVGLAECLFFVYALNRSAIEFGLKHTTGSMSLIDAIDVSAIALCFLAPVAVGAAFAYLASGGTIGWRRALTAGGCLLGASLIGLQLALTLEPLGARFTAVGVFRFAFTLASGTAALLCTWGVARLLGREEASRKALVTGLATAAIYLVYAVAIDPLPGFHVGGGNMGMPRVAMLGNLVAGAIGGALAFRLLASRTLRCVEVQRRPVDCDDHRVVPIESAKPTIGERTTMDDKVSMASSAALLLCPTTGRVKSADGAAVEDDAWRLEQA